MKFFRPIPNNSPAKFKTQNPPAFIPQVTDIFLLENSSTHSRAVALRPCEAPSIRFSPFLRAENAVSVLPNPLLTEAVHFSHFDYKTLKVLRLGPNPSSPQKIVWQNRVHRIGTRIPSVSPLEKPALARHHHTEKRKLESRKIKKECVVARRGRNGTAEAEEHAPACSGADAEP